MNRITVNLISGAVAAAALAAGLATAAPASAATLSISYAVSGSTLVAKPNATSSLGPTTLTTALKPTGSFTGSLPLPSTTASFSALGLLPTSSTVSFIPVGKVTGKLTSKGARSVVTATATYIIKLSNLTVGPFGLPIDVGNNCQTTSPVSIPVSTPANQSFNITDGGTVTGVYTIGSFGNCGIMTLLINQLVPGPNNTVTLNLSNGRIAN